MEYFLYSWSTLFKKMAYLLGFNQKVHTGQLIYCVYQATPYKLEEVGKYMHILRSGDSLSYEKVLIKC